MQSVKVTFFPEILTLYKISDTRKTLIPIQGMPVFDSRNLYELLENQEIIKPKDSDKSYIEQLQKSSVGATQFFKQLAMAHDGQSSMIRMRGLQGVFAVSGNIFYMGIQL